MKATNKKQADTTAGNRFVFKRNPLAAACAMAIFAMSVHAQQADPATQEAAKQEAWLELELVKARAANAMPVIFQHIPFFLEQAEEPDQYFNIPLATRGRVLTMLKKSGVHYVFAGHYHRNSYGKDEELEMITTGPAGMPIGPDPSGLRIVEVKNGKLLQDYYSLGRLPNTYPPAPEKK